MRRSLTFKFNTALTSLGEKGEFNEEYHKELVMPIRAALMSLDGMTGCRIARYDVEVSFLTEVVSVKLVTQHVREVFAKFAQKTDAGPADLPEKMYFSSRGTKQVKLTLDRPKPTRHRVVEIRYDSSLVRYPVSNEKDQQFNRFDFEAETKPLVVRMVDIDGVLGWQCEFRYASLTIDTSVVSVDEAKAHLKQVFTDIARGNKYFPYLQPDQVPHFTFQVKNH